MKDFFRIYSSVLSKYSVFKGRSRRKEYWTFTLINVFVIIVFNSLSGFESFIPFLILPILSLFVLFTLLPSIAILVRRYHDVGLSGLWAILMLIILFLCLFLLGAQFLKFFLFLFLAAFARGGGIPDDVINNYLILICVVTFAIFFLINIFITTRKGTTGENKYGADPKET